MLAATVMRRQPSISMQVDGNGTRKYPLTVSDVFLHTGGLEVKKEYGSSVVLL